MENVNLLTQFKESEREKMMMLKYASLRKDLDVYYEFYNGGEVVYSIVNESKKIYYRSTIIVSAFAANLNMVKGATPRYLLFNDLDKVLAKGSLKSTMSFRIKSLLKKPFNKY